MVPPSGENRAQESEQKPGDQQAAERFERRGIAPDFLLFSHCRTHQEIVPLLNSGAAMRRQLRESV